MHLSGSKTGSVQVYSYLGHGKLASDLLYSTVMAYGSNGGHFRLSPDE